MDALAGQAEALLGRLFWLLGRLREPESCVRLLQAVSVVVEVRAPGVPVGATFRALRHSVLAPDCVQTSLGYPAACQD